MEAFVTMITPYTKDGEIDYATAEKYVDWYFETGLDGIFAVCQSSEIFWLSLEERVKLNSVVYNRAKALEKEHGRKFSVVSSGHISDSLEDQAKELTAIWESGIDNLILITNRLDLNNEGDDVFIEKKTQRSRYWCTFIYKDNNKKTNIIISEFNEDFSKLTLHELNINTNENKESDNEIFRNAVCTSRYRQSR